MTREDALDAVWRAHMVAKAVGLMAEDDLREPCFWVLCSQALSQASRELAQAYETLREA